ncbi:TorD/DmsD family molecular chaperone [Rubneribacter sp.]
MREDEERALARAQAALLSTAARVMRRPDAALAEDVIAGRLSQGLESLVGEGAEGALRALGELRAFEGSVAHVAPDELRLRLEVDYNRLFVGPGALKAPPYESYYASEARAPGSGRLRTEEERQVAGAYARCGYAVPEGLAELPDHVAVELEFLALLARDEAAAWEAGDDRRALELQDAQEGFVEEHLGRWIEQLAARVRAEARCPLYPAVIDVAAAYCA